MLISAILNELWSVMNHGSTVFHVLFLEHWNKNSVVYPKQKSFWTPEMKYFVSAFYKQANLLFLKSTQPYFFIVKQCTKFNQYVNNFSLLSLHSCSSLVYAVEFVVIKNVCLILIISFLQCKWQEELCLRTFLKKLNNYNCLNPNYFVKTSQILQKLWACGRS